MELINSVNIDALYALASKLIVLVGVMAFLVSVVTQVLKQIPGLEKRVPTQITVIVTSMILCPAAMAAMAETAAAAISIQVLRNTIPGRRAVLARRWLRQHVSALSSDWQLQL